MAIITFINDVNVISTGYSSIIGQLDWQPTGTGNQQAIDIANYFNEKVEGVAAIYTSGARRVSKLIHNIRTTSKDRYLLSVQPQEAPELLERNFGVLQGNTYTFQSDIFKHSRICAKGGESIAQCRDRAILLVQGILKQRVTHALLVSHPFLCQILSNWMANQALTRLTNFWMTKGSFATFESTVSGWAFMSAHNALTGRSYKLVLADGESIYNNLEFVGHLDV